MVPMEELESSGLKGKAGSHNPFQHFGDGLEEDDNPKGGRRLLRGLATFVQNKAIGFFERGGVMPKLQQRGKKVGQEVGSN